MSTALIAVKDANNSLVSSTEDLAAAYFKAEAFSEISICWESMLLDNNSSKLRPKGHWDRRIYACFVHQTKDTQTIEENVKEAATVKAL